MAATSSVKLSAETDQLLIEASHFLSRSKKNGQDRWHAVMHRASAAAHASPRRPIASPFLTLRV